MFKTISKALKKITLEHEIFDNSLQRQKTQRNTEYPKFAPYMRHLGEDHKLLKNSNLKEFYPVYATMYKKLSPEQQDLLPDMRQMSELYDKSDNNTVYNLFEAANQWLQQAGKVEGIPLIPSINVKQLFKDRLDIEDTSAFKNHPLLSEQYRSLLDDNGNLRSDLNALSIYPVSYAEIRSKLPTHLQSKLPSREDLDKVLEGGDPEKSRSWLNRVNRSLIGLLHGKETDESNFLKEFDTSNVTTRITEPLQANIV